VASKKNSKFSQVVKPNKKLSHGGYLLKGEREEAIKTHKKLYNI